MGTKFNIRKNCIEYVFARVIDDYNKAQIGDGKHFLTASQGRALHKRVEKEVCKKNAVFENNLRPMFIDVMNKESMRLFGIQLVQPDSIDAVFNNLIDDYTHVTHIEKGREGTTRRELTGAFDYDGYIPVSPFDHEYEQRETILNRGTEIMYVKASDAVRMSENQAFDASTPGSAPFYMEFLLDTREKQYDVPLYRLRGNMEKGSAHFISSKTDKLYTEADQAGLAKLRRYMSEADYKNAVPWMKAVPENMRMSEDGMNAAVYLLAELMQSGRSFSVKRDRHEGQLKVETGKVSIRLTETAGNEMYIGRTYKDGHAMYLYIPNFVNGKESEMSFDSRLDFVTSLVSYAVGGHVERLNLNSARIGATVGSTGKWGRDGKNATYMYLDPKTNTPVMRTLLGFTKETGTNGPYSVMVATKNDHSEAHRFFSDESEAEVFLRDAVTSARERFMKEVGVERLIEEAKIHGADESYVPEYSLNPAIAPIQRIYWDVLRGESELYHQTGDDEVTQELQIGMGLVDEFDNDGENMQSDVSSEETQATRVAYSGTPEEKVRQHFEDSMDLLIGTYDENASGKRFNPMTVSSFMSSAYGIYRNSDNLVAAMSKLNFTGDELMGTDFQTGLLKDKLLKFDPESAQRMGELKSPFMKSMYEAIQLSIQEMGCVVNPEDITIDKNGVVHYVAHQVYDRVGDNVSRIEGQLGQIFEPDADGVVETRYNGSQNKLFTPGYEAYVRPQIRADTQKSFIERVTLIGLEQRLRQNISETIRYDILGKGDAVIEGKRLVSRSVGTTTNINHTYRGLYGTNYKVSIKQREGETLKDTYMRQLGMTHFPADMAKARFETARGLIHFNKDIAENSTVSAEYFASRESEQRQMYNKTNDNVFSAYVLTDHTNMAITQKHSEGCSDPVLTGSGKNQGIVRYLAKGVQVDRDGSIIRTDDANAKAPWAYISPMKYVDYIPADRVQMVGSNFMTASGIAGAEGRELDDGTKVNGVGMAMLTLQGLTFDDGAVVSSDFAKRYGVVGEDGEIRSLTSGDKICDFAGNKSIVAKVIDRNMDEDTAREEGVLTAVKLFKANPDLDIVQAPYSAVSRFNAASAKLLMETPKDLVLPDGTVKEGCLGFAPVILTCHTADEHTKEYGEEAAKQGRGRRVSALESAALCAAGATNIVKEIYMANNGAVSDFRESLNVLGFDMDEVGRLRREYEQHAGEDRYVFQLPRVEGLDKQDMDDAGELFKTVVNARGGVLEIPFPITFMSGETTPLVDKSKSAYPERDMYALPVLSSRMRSGQSFVDGTSQTHDYTNQYVRIFKSAIEYLQMSENGATPEAMNLVRRSAETSFNSIADSIFQRKFNTKHNIAREQLLSCRLPNSLTAVWTPDTNLKLNEIAMNGTMMKNKGLKPGDYMLCWRDPILRTNGVKYMKVVQNDNLTGVAVNPLIAVAMDGDFDGDSVGGTKLHTEAARKDAMEKFSFEYTLLDTTRRRENGDFALMINDSMDVISAEAVDEERRNKAIAEGMSPEEYGPTLRERRMALEHKANELYRANASFEERTALIDELSDWAKDCLCETCATEVVSFKDMKSHVDSLLSIVQRKAKGSEGKLKMYMQYLGAEFETTPDGHIDVSTIKDVGHTMATKDMQCDTQLATAIKSHGTGNAGTVTQRIILAMRNRGIVFDNPMPDEVRGENELRNEGTVQQENALGDGLKLSYLATQGILQAKHDPIQAQHLYAMLQSEIRAIWRGQKMQSFKEYDEKLDKVVRKWEVVKDCNGVPEQASKEEWCQMFLELHEDSDGLDLAGAINHDHVKMVADCLFDKTTGRMMDIEDYDTIYKIASPMDMLAYRPNDALQTLNKLSKDRRNLFEGEYNRLFAPKRVFDNMVAFMRNEPEKIHALTASDTSVDYKVRENAAYDVDAEKVTVEEFYSEPVVVQAETVSTAESNTEAASTSKKKEGLSIDYSKAAETVTAPVFEKSTQAYGSVSPTLTIDVPSDDSFEMGE